MQKGRYDEAIQRHLRAADLLEEALLLTTSPKAAESIKLQCEYHRKQKDIIKLIKEQQELFKKTVEKREMNAAKLCNPKWGAQLNLEAELSRREIIPHTLKMKVNSIMDDADSLVDILIKKYQDDTNKEPESDIDLKQLSIIQAVYKDPKDDKMVMEELKTVNHHLREVIMQLLSQLDQAEHENKHLRRRVCFLENGSIDAVEVEPSPQPSPNHKQMPTIHMDAVEDESPFIYSPGSDLSPESGEMRELPPLAPLEMPDFNFEAMMSQLRVKREENERKRNEAEKKT